jgi:hypothetical protein
MQSLADVESKIASAEEKGMEKGIDVTKKQTVINAYQSGLDIEMICQIAKLNQDKIKEIIRSIG